MISIEISRFIGFESIVSLTVSIFEELMSFFWKKPVSFRILTVSGICVLYPISGL